MAGQVSNPASLFQLYVDYGRFTEATNLLLEYTESFASVVSQNHFKNIYISSATLLVQVCFIFSIS